MSRIELIWHDDRLLIIRSDRVVSEHALCRYDLGGYEDDPDIPIRVSMAIAKALQGD